MHSTAIETFIDLLKQGKSVIHMAEGYSMFPTLRPGDKVMIKPLAKGEIPEPGNIIVAVRDNILVLHRLVNVRYNDERNPEYITRGDSRREADEPSDPGQILCVAVSYKRGGNEFPVRPKIPGRTRYMLNSVLLWSFGKWLGIKSYLKRSDLLSILLLVYGFWTFINLFLPLLN
jgi:signal peptidase I